MIAHVGRGIAEAQAALDAQTFESFKKLYDVDNKVGTEMRQLGFSPTWYRIPEAEAEIRMSISIGSRERQPGLSPAGAPEGARAQSMQLYAAPIDASYANKYQFQAEGVSRVKFKIVAVPPSQQADAARVVPKGLELKKFGDVKALLDEWEIDYIFDPVGRTATNPDSLTVVEVSPASGSVLKPGAKVTLKLN